MANYIYVACGEHIRWSFLNTIERIDIGRLISGEQNVAWELLNIAGNELLMPRSGVSMAALNADQLLIFGGFN